MLEFAGNIFLVGKIDIFTINREIISVIEVKTSKSEGNYHSVQNKFYADLLNKVLGDKLDIKPLLWYPNPKNTRLKPKTLFYWIFYCYYNNGKRTKGAAVNKFQSLFCWIFNCYPYLIVVFKFRFTIFLNSNLI